MKVPLYLERGLIEITAITCKGPLRCVLDTGATLNFINYELAEGETMDQSVWKPENSVKFSHFHLNERDFGPLEFRRIPIHVPIHIEAILGMEFFEEHVIFLDFAEKVAYID